MNYEYIEGISMQAETKVVAAACASWCEVKNAEHDEIFAETKKIYAAIEKYDALPFYKKWGTKRPELQMFHWSDHNALDDFYAYVIGVGLACRLSMNDILIINMYDGPSIRLAKIVKDYMDGKTL